MGVPIVRQVTLQRALACDLRYSSAVMSDKEGPEEGETRQVAAEDWAALAGHQRLLLGEDPSLTMEQMAQQAGVDLEMAERFWRAMGFADVSPEDVRFTGSDAAALRNTLSLMGQDKSDGGMDLATVLELLRAQSYTMDRLVLWQFETLVGDLIQRRGLDDTQARLAVLSEVGDMVDILSKQLAYVWRRHLASLLSRTDAEVANRDREETGPDYYPLTRSLGFVDIVSFTQRAQGMSKRALTLLLEDFENTARDVVTSRGARVVKTIGDAVMYIADDLPTAADVVTSLVEELQGGPDAIRVRASLVHGRVVSRSGDVFGPTVNLASRLVDTAEPGGIRMDEATAMAILHGPVARRYRVGQCHEVVAKGLGQIVPWSLERA